jgi:hypothetical protein
MHRLVTDPIFSDRVPIPRSRKKPDRIPHFIPLGGFGSRGRSDPISDPSLQYRLGVKSEPGVAQK